MNINNIFRLSFLDVRPSISTDLDLLEFYDVSRWLACQLACSIVRQDKDELADTSDSWVGNSAANRLIGEVVQSLRRPLLGPSPG